MDKGMDKEGVGCVCVCVYVYIYMYVCIYIMEYYSAIKKIK